MDVLDIIFNFLIFVLGIVTGMNISIGILKRKLNVYIYKELKILLKKRYDRNNNQ